MWKVLLSEPAAELSSWPLDLVALRERISREARHTIKQLQASHQEELSQLRAELGRGSDVGGEGDSASDKWRRRRNLSFDQNRQLEEVTKERDGFKKVACTLRRVVTQLIAYCADAEDEINKTVLTEVLTHLVGQSDGSFVASSRPSSPNSTALSPMGTDLDSSAVSRGRRVHFAPDFKTFFSDMDEDALLDYLQNQDNLSLEIKNELDSSLKRLRHEAQELLNLSGKFSTRQSLPPAARRSLLMADEEIGARRLSITQGGECVSCDHYRKRVETLESDCLEREGMMRSELRAAMLKLALLTEEDSRADLIAEGYGTLQHPRTPVSLPVKPNPVTPPALDSRSVSLDGSERGRRAVDIARLTHELEAVMKERDDLHMQLEAANRQLRSTRQFVEEQTSEREAERDDFAKQVAELREDNIRLSQRLHANARIVNEVEQLEAQTREMTVAIHEIESRKAETDTELEVTLEKVVLLRDVIKDLESRLEQKAVSETEILEKLEEMRQTIDERDKQMRGLLEELEGLRNEKTELEASCIKCEHSQDEADTYAKYLVKVKEQAQWLENSLHRRTQLLERLHESVCSTCCSEPSEDVSIRDQKKTSEEEKPTENSSEPSPTDRLPELLGVWDGLEALGRAEEAAVKRVRDLEMQRTQLKDVAQEVRAERDVLQQRMSEQALKISSLKARLEVQRTHAEALCHESTSQLSVRLHDALAEVQRLTEELESKDKQLTRMRLMAEEERSSLQQQQNDSLTNVSCLPRDKIIILERELSAAHSKVAKLEALARSLETDKANLLKQQKECQRQIAEKDAQLQELLALKLDEGLYKEKNEVVEGGKNSARTLSDIVSISEYDDQDNQMRRAELKQHNISGVLYQYENKSLNRTLPPDLNEKPHASSLSIDHTVDHLDLAHYSPHSLPMYYTSTANKDVKLLDLYKRNANESTVFGGIAENLSMFPNREATDNKDITIEPKKINFSIEHSTKEENKFKSLEELGITIDYNHEYFPDILAQLKHEIISARAEVNQYKAEVNMAKEQLRELPALQKEVYELKNVLEGSIGTMDNDKLFYENQLKAFADDKKLLDQQLARMAEQVTEKSNDLHLLKEDLLRRENMILELAKEKRNLVNKIAELQMKYDTLERKNDILENHERENKELKDKLFELRKMEQLVSEKNLQIDNLNEHLNRLDDMQRCLDDKNEETDRLKEIIGEKESQIQHLRDSMQVMSRELNTISSENSKFVIEVGELKDKLSEATKEQENSSLKLQNNLYEMERLTSCNQELLSEKLDETKILTDKLKDKECEIEILNEDINYFHGEIASLKDELKLVSRSPSPRDAKGGELKGKTSERKVNADKKELVKIRKHVSLLQHELALNKKELNEKAFELARANFDVTELKNNLNQIGKLAFDRETAFNTVGQENVTLRQEMQKLAIEKETLRERLAAVESRIREEGNLKELEDKLKAKTEQCSLLQEEVEALKETIERIRESPSRTLAILPANEEHALMRSTQRSPTAELENAVRVQLNYSNRLDDSIMEQILSGASRDDSDDDVPRLQLDISRSSLTSQSSSARISELKSANEKLRVQVTNLEARLKDKEALINELNRVRDKLVQDWQTAKLQYETEKDNSGRLQLLLDTQKHTSDSLQNQDQNMICMLKKRLESSMESELELQKSVQRERLRSVQLERQLGDLSAGSDSGRDASALRVQRDNLVEANERLQGELALLKSKLEREKNRLVDLQNIVDQNKMQFQREVEARNDQCTTLKQELAELRRLKHELGVELVRARETIHQQKNTIANMSQKGDADAQRIELSREIAALKRSIDMANLHPTSPAPASHIDMLLQLKDEKAALQDKVRNLENDIVALKNKGYGLDDKDQAVRYLHSRCLRLESIRKALVWQKRYLQRVLAGHEELERVLERHAGAPVPPPRRIVPRFKSIAVAVMCVVRIQFLVRRRQLKRHVGSEVLLRRNRDQLCKGNAQSRSPYVSNSPPSRDRATPNPHTPPDQTLFYTPPVIQRHLAANLPRNMRPDVRVYIEPSTIGERPHPTADCGSRTCSSPIVRSGARSSSTSESSTSVHTSSSREHQTAASALGAKLEHMSRRLHHLIDDPRDIS